MPKLRVFGCLQSITYRAVCLTFRNGGDNEKWYFDDDGGGFFGRVRGRACAGLAAGVEQPAPIPPGGNCADCAGTSKGYEAGLFDLWFIGMPNKKLASCIKLVLVDGRRRSTTSDTRGSVQLESIFGKCATPDLCHL